MRPAFVNTSKMRMQGGGQATAKGAALGWPANKAEAIARRQGSRKGPSPRREVGEHQSLRVHSCRKGARLQRGRVLRNGSLLLHACGRVNKGVGAGCGLGHSCASRGGSGRRSWLAGGGRQACWWLLKGGRQHILACCHKSESGVQVTAA